MILPMCAGGEADIFLDRAEQEDEQRIREVICERRSRGICCHDSPHDEAVRPSLRTFHTASEGEFSAPLCQAALCECARESVERLLKTASETRLLRHRRASLRDLPSAIFLR